VMILDFSSAVGWYIGVSVVGILLCWVLARRGKDKDLSLDRKFIWFCTICTHTYVNTRDEHLCVCPRCGSYNKK